MASSVSQRWDLSDAVTACNYSNQSEVVALITNRYTPLYFEDAVLTKLYQDPRSLANQVLQNWPREQFDYGQNSVPFKEVYNPAYVPRGMQYLKDDNVPMPDEVTNPELNANAACVLCYEDIPTGGFSKMQGRFVRADYRTAPICVRQIVGARQYWTYAERMMADRMMTEQTVMTNFYNLVAHTTSGYKVLLESDRPASELGNARALLDLYPQTYMEDQFPQVHDPEKIQPLSFGIIQQLSERMGYDYNLNRAAVQTDNGPVWTWYVPDDWYNVNVRQNPQWTENLRWEAPGTLFQGFNPGIVQGTSNVHVIGNARIVTNGDLPRYTWDCALHGVVEVQPFAPVNTEIGVENVRNPDWLNAPFAVARLYSPLQAKILTQPDITLSSGIAVPNIQGNAEGIWEPWNEYDPLCNPERNLPYWKFHYRLGFIGNEPWTAVEILYRRALPSYPAPTQCNLVPVTTDTAGESLCDDLNGPCSQREPVDASLTKTRLGDEVRYTATACGGTRYIRVRVEFQANRPGGLITPACGSTVKVFYSDASFDTGTILDVSWAQPSRPYDEYFIDLGSGNSVPTGECVTLLQDLDASPTTALIIACVGADVCDELDANQIKIFVDHSLVCGGGDTEFVINTVDTTEIVVTIIDSAPEEGWYIVQATGLDCADGGGVEGGTFECQAP